MGVKILLTVALLGSRTYFEFIVVSKADGVKVKVICALEQHVVTFCLEIAAISFNLRDNGCNLVVIKVKELLGDKQYEIIIFSLVADI